MGPNFNISLPAMRVASRSLTSNRSGQYTRPAVNTVVICLASQFCPVTWRLCVPLGKYSEKVGPTRSIPMLVLFACTQYFPNVFGPYIFPNVPNWWLYDSWSLQQLQKAYMTLEELAVTLNHLNGNVQLFMATRNSSFHMYTYMLSFGNANVGDLYVNRRVSGGGGGTVFYT